MKPRTIEAHQVHHDVRAELSDPSLRSLDTLRQVLSRRSFHDLYGGSWGTLVSFPGWFFLPSVRKS